MDYFRADAQCLTERASLVLASLEGFCLPPVNASLDELSDDELLSLAPKLFRELAHRISIRSLMKLGLALGGRRVVVPVHANPASPNQLGLVLSHSELAALSYERRGDRIEIPILNSLKSELLVREVLRLTQDGRSARRIAIELGMSERNVYRMRARGRTTPKGTTTPKRRS